MLKSLVTRPWDENYVYTKNFNMLPRIKDVIIRVDQSRVIRVDPNPPLVYVQCNTLLHSHHTVTLACTFLGVMYIEPVRSQDVGRFGHMSKEERFRINLHDVL